MNDLKQTKSKNNDASAKEQKSKNFFKRHPVWSVILIVLVLAVTKSAMGPFITVQQQNNVVMKIVRYYNVKSVRFTRYSEPGLGSGRLLYIRLDENSSTDSSVSPEYVDDNFFNSSDGNVALSGVENYDKSHYVRKKALNNSELKDAMKKVKIYYLPFFHGWDL
ncbi:hypothetical protein ACFQY8_01705 [Alloscardovia venturai]|uniref:Uncharacterized protein n=1 Tax=Alloscardovia venturai TaxID=1769421 RepID=A0ABW2Y2K0_9BIFI